jgi:pimeloyl-ACP methyl ester carboxylesterase
MSGLTAPTQFAEAAGTRFAYRRFGAGPGAPLLLVQFFMGNLDGFDPAVTDALAAGREVILFDNAGVGLSTGTAPATIAGMARDAGVVEQDDLAPATIAGMARDAGALADALGLAQIDVFGHSMGGHVAQQLTIDRPGLVRRLVLAGTGPRGGEGMRERKPEVSALFTAKPEPRDLMWLPVFFAPSPASQAAGRRYLDRIRGRRAADRDVPVSAATITAHLAARAEWGLQLADGFAYLQAITQPVLVVNGHADIIVPTVNSYLLQQNLPDAELVLYPDSGHGAHFQYPGRFTRQVTEFLDRPGSPAG